MDCHDARVGLWPPERPRLAAPDVLDARSHVEGCPECRDFFSQDRLLLDAYDRLRAIQAPGPVREHVFDALAHERAGLGGVPPAPALRAPRRKRSARWPFVAGAAVATVAAAFSLSLPPTGASVDEATAAGGMFVDDYMRRAVSEDHIVTRNPSEVRRFIARELGMPVRPLELDGLVLERAEICLLEGRRGALIVYRKNGAPVSHYLVPRDGAEPREPVLRGDMRTGGGGSVPVVTWSTRSLEQALVGELDGPELLRIARASTEGHVGTSS